VHLIAVDPEDDSNTQMNSVAVNWAVWVKSANSALFRNNDHPQRIEVAAQLKNHQDHSPEKPEEYHLQFGRTAANGLTF
jgi:hypothetical protein